MLLKYKIKTKDGGIEEGTIESADRFALASEIRAKGNIPLEIKEAKNDLMSSLDVGQFLEKIKLQDLILFTKNISGMLKAGLAVARALSVLEKQTKKQKFKKIITSLINDINDGGSFSGGLAKYPKVFSPLFVSMVRAGEESGNLAGALTEIGISLEKTENLNKKVKGAMIYPGVIISAMGIIGILMFAFVVPTLAKTFKELGAKLPPTTQFVLNTGDFISNNLILVFVALFGIIFGVMYLFRAPFMARYLDFAILRIPAISTMSKELNTARTARTISSLLSSGVSIIRAIEITKDVVQNIYYKELLSKAISQIEKGFPLSKIFTENTNLYPVMMGEMVQVGEETGKLSEMLSEIALFYETEIENKTKNLSTIIEPVLMILIGAGVGFFALSMITPLYSILETIG